MGLDSNSSRYSITGSRRCKIARWTWDEGYAKRGRPCRFAFNLMEVVMEMIKDQLVADMGDQSAPALKRWVAPVVEAHDVEDLTMAGPTNTADGGFGSS